MNVLLTQYDGAILGPIAKVLGFILQGIYAFFDLFGVHNVGLCIILFTFIVNGLMIPITIKQQKFSKLNSIMTPEIQAIQAKYKNKKDQESVRMMNAEQQAIYAKYGVSPTAGCLPMLITLPIFFALYRVIYNVPAYVPQIKELYENVINAVQQSSVDLSEFSKNVASFVKDVKVPGITAQNNPITSQSLGNADTILKSISELSGGAFTDSAKNYIIDILSQFSPSNWNDFINLGIFKGTEIPAQLTSMYEGTGANVGISSVYNFIGMNVMDKPTWTNFTILVPIFAVISQFASNKILMSSNKTNKKTEDAASSTMNAMNNFMPIISGVFCFMFPIGVGLYWVAGSVFRMIQGLFINAYFDKVGLDEIAAKNVEKKKKKLERKGIDPNSTKMQELAKTRTSSIKSSANTTISDNLARRANSNSAKNSSKGSSKNSKQDLYINRDIKGGSISDIANMLNRNYDNDDNVSDKDDK